MSDTIETTREVDVVGHTLVVPALTIGNVPQLAVDLVAATLGFTRAATLDHPALLAVCGNDAFTPAGTGVLCTAAELFQRPGVPVTLLQLRAPPVTGRRGEWAAALAEWAAAHRVARLLLLVSADSRHMHSPDALNVPWIIVRDSRAWNRAAAGAVNCTDWQEMSAEAEMQAVREGATSDALLKQCATRGVPCAALVALCAEGDNAADAGRLATWLCRSTSALAQLRPDTWTAPPSWGVAAFWGASTSGSVPTLF